MKRFSERIQKKIISADKTIIQTMKSMDESCTKLFLVFAGDRFLGIITNGDLQRAIIANIPFDTQIGEIVSREGKLFAQEGDDRDKIKEWMLSKRSELMPILDKSGNLIDVIFWDDLFKESQTDNRAKINLPVVIMAGGMGTRLKPITNVIPKPLIPVGDKTILEVILDQFEGIGCNKFYMSVNYKADMIKYYLSQIDHKYNIEFFQEEKPLGTIGSVSLLKEKISTPFFVSNCDSINEQDYRDVYDYHVKNHNDLTIVTMVKSFKIPYGVIETGKDGLMKALSEKPEVTYQINTGVYILNPSCIEEIPVGEVFHVTQLMEKMKLRGARVGCFPVSEKAWKDMGEWPEYLKMINVL
ncbi:MAG: mannose-1-phosphate guanylyltransferase [Bacteroidales bacterium]|jgi:dTDP-glucose pyrophosphorylase|nr:mannose-1-phosphate guanylyltransferase [Bacteroidales bacterium]